MRSKESRQTIVSFIKIAFVAVVLLVAGFEYSQVLVLRQENLLLRNKTDNLNNELLSFRDNFQNLQSTFQNLQSNHTSLRSDYGKLLSSYESIANSLGFITNETNSLKDDLRITKVEKEQLQIQLEEIQASLEDYVRQFDGMKGVFVMNWTITWRDGMYYDRSNTLQVSIFNFLSSSSITLIVYGNSGNSHEFAYDIPSGRYEVQAFWTDANRLEYDSVKIIAVMR